MGRDNKETRYYKLDLIGGAEYYKREFGSKWYIKRLGTGEWAELYGMCLRYTKDKMRHRVLKRMTKEDYFIAAL